ncbi:hypothetical protein HY256_03095, partial [Candidatus Sumerlaeota bacterium]|nr:hypothetical protein [Candidatus Sumerlaeota bacterium]
GVAGRQDEQHGALDVFRGRASAVVAPLVRAEEFCPLLSAHFSPSGMKLDYLFMGRELQLDLPLYGTFIAENLQNALALFATLAEHRLIPQPDPRKIADSLSSISIPGRMEPLAEYPRMILDCGHCPTAAAAISETMESHFDSEPAVAVIGMAVDKDHAGFFEALARWKGWKGMVCYTLPHPRGASAETLASRAAPYFPSVLWRTNLSEALELANSLTENYTRLIAAGSAYGVGPASDWGKTHGRRSAPRKNRT